MEQTHRIACEIFTLVKIPVRHESVYDIMHIGIEYLLRWCPGTDRNVLHLRNIFISELCSSKLFAMLREKTEGSKVTTEEKFLYRSLELCRQRREYRESVYDCIILLEQLWLQGMDNEFEQTFDGLLARNVVRNEIFVPFTKRPATTYRISLKNIPV